MPRRSATKKKPSTDPLAEIANAFDSAVRTAKAGQHEAEGRSAAHGIGSKSPAGYVYAGSYVLTFGVMFPALMIARGVTDGVRAARAQAKDSNENSQA
jgi:hypothetical protein